MPYLAMNLYEYQAKIALKKYNISLLPAMILNKEEDIKNSLFWSKHKFIREAEVKRVASFFVIHLKKFTQQQKLSWGRILCGSNDKSRSWAIHVCGYWG